MQISYRSQYCPCRARCRRAQGIHMSDEARAVLALLSWKTWIHQIAIPCDHQLSCRRRVVPCLARRCYPQTREIRSIACPGHVIRACLSGWSMTARGEQYPQPEYGSDERYKNSS